MRRKAEVVSPAARNSVSVKLEALLVVLLKETLRMKARRAR
jgi:hypothetical protein